MDIALAQGKVSEYMTKMTDKETEIASLEQDLEHVASSAPGPLPSGRPAASKAIINQKLVQAKTVHGLYKSFLDFWQKAIEGIVGVLGAFKDLAFPR